MNNKTDIEEKNEDAYWKGYIQKQNEAVEICKICKICKYKAKANKYDSLVEKIKEKIEAYSKNCTVVNSFIVEALEDLLKGE